MGYLSCFHIWLLRIMLLWKFVYTGVWLAFLWKLNIEHLLMCWLVTCISFLEIRQFFHFLIGSFVFFFFELQGFYIFWLQVLHQIDDLNIFSNLVPIQGTKCKVCALLSLVLANLHSVSHQEINITHTFIVWIPKCQLSCEGDTSRVCRTHGSP